MAWVATAIIASTVVSAGVGMYASSKASSAQQKAAESAAASSDKGLQAQLEMFYQQREDLEPWREAGTESVNKLLEMQREGPPEFTGPGDFEASPGYQFRLDEGQKSLERSAASKGRLLSGGSLKAAQRYGQDYATNEYDNFLRRYYDRANFAQNQYYNKLTPYQSLAGVGQTSVNQSYQNQPNYMQWAGQQGQAALQAGQAKAQGYANMSNIVSGGINSGAQNYMLSQYLNPAMGGAAGG